MYVLHLSVLLLAVFARCEACPPWSTPYSNAEDNSTHCKCGSDLGGVVDCNNSSLQIRDCYCMTYNRKLNKTLVGYCTVRCIYLSVQWQQVLSKNPKFLNSEFCQNYKREGQLCGKCIKGYGPPVYSYTYQCVKCHNANVKVNSLKYVAVAFIPLTLFYLLVIILKVRANSDFMMAYVMICQLVTAPFETRLLMTKGALYYKVVIGIFGIWNLDILRSIYSPFCIHPDMTTLQVLALDYLIGVYPLVLIIVTYIAVKLHDRYSLVVRLWRPVNRLCMCIRQEWDIRGSLVQAFATFLVLSYVKILNVSFDLLTPVSLWTPEGKHLNQSYLYNAGETPYFGREHLPYGVLAVVMLTVFNIFPVILLFLYPCSCCHKCLNSCHLNSRALYTFMDAFQGCYHHRPRERRYFAAIYLTIRVLQAVFFVLVRDTTFSSFTGISVAFVLVAVAIFKPYQKKHQNTVDVVVLSMFFVGTYINLLYDYSLMKETLSNARMYKFLWFLLSPFICVYTVYINARIIIPTKWFHWFKRCIIRFKNDRPEGPLPLFFDREDEHSPLVAT